MVPKLGKYNYIITYKRKQTKCTSDRPSVCCTKGEVETGWSLHIIKQSISIRSISSSQHIAGQLEGNFRVKRVQLEDSWLVII